MTDAPPDLWRNREFNLLWVSQSLSDLGTAISSLAVPLLVLALTGRRCGPGWSARSGWAPRWPRR